MTEPQDSTHPAIMGIEHYGGHSAITYRWRGGIVRSEGPAGRTAERVEEIAAFVDHDTHLAHARYLGADAALTSVVDHYMMSAYEARAYLSPEADDRLSPYPPPELVEWQVGCGESFASMLGVDVLTAEHTNAWHEGMNMVWSDALQATALRVLGDTQAALALERDIGNRVDALRAAAGL